MILPEELSRKNIKIIQKNGLQEQLSKLMEECGEIVQAANKYRMAINKQDYMKARRKEKDLLIEIADAIVIMDQVLEYLGVDQAEVIQMASYKIDRKLGRMKG